VGRHYLYSIAGNHTKNFIAQIRRDLLAACKVALRYQDLTRRDKIGSKFSVVIPAKLSIMSLAKGLDSLGNELEAPANDEFDDVIFPPSDLLSDEPPLESYLHLQQLILLLTSLEWWWRDGGPSVCQDFFAAGNLTVYYSPRQLKSEYFRGPDFFVVLGTERKPRKSWVVWEEGGQYPNVVVEILSNSTAGTDRGLKKQIYQDIWRTPDYFWFDPVSLEFQGFHLLDGKYQALQLNEQGWLWSQQLGFYLGIQASTLRFFSSDGQLISTPAEAAAQAELQLNQECQRADRLAEKLRELGVDPSKF
jgi:Uma2 family endonuclease